MEPGDNDADDSPAGFQESAMPVSGFESGLEFGIRRVRREGALARDAPWREACLAYMEVHAHGPEAASGCADGVTPDQS
jgi:hypothetical protein